MNSGMEQLSQDYFSLFGLPLSYDMDTQQLDASYRKLQAEVHPDRFVTASSTERMHSMQLATQTNEAYRTLKHPTDRARYLLKLKGVDTQEENNTAMPMDFLMLQMEWREAMEEAHGNQNVAQLEQLKKEIKQATKTLHANLSTALTNTENTNQATLQLAAEHVRKLSFMDKMMADIEAMIVRLED